jgi:hypothetical protein
MSMSTSMIMSTIAIAGMGGRSGMNAKAFYHSNTAERAIGGRRCD